jgi:hypothetical protein
MTENIRALLEKTSKDPALFSNIDIDTLLNGMENRNNEYLENKTASSITAENLDVVCSLGLPEDKQREMFSKLTDYRYVDELRELHKGKHIRWIKRSEKPAKLTNGGIVVDILFKDNGTHILCKNAIHRFIQYKFDDCFTFQKMTTNELFILAAYEHLRIHQETS